MSKLAKTVQGFLNMSNKSIQKSFSTNSIIQKSMREKKLWETIYKNSMKSRKCTHLQRP